MSGAPYRTPGADSAIERSVRTGGLIKNRRYFGPEKSFRTLTGQCEILLESHTALLFGSDGQGCLAKTNRMCVTSEDPKRPYTRTHHTAPKSVKTRA
jgi:hypothetical protein